MPDSSTLIVVFGKAPQPGRVKTRLAAALGEGAAARLHARLLERTLRTALSANCGDVELHGSPARHTFLRALARRHAVRLVDQSGGDVGRRMYEAFRTGLRRYRQVILVGSDCPALRPADFRKARRMLSGLDAVLAPAEDGGYPLIGLSRNAVSLFEGIEWSSETVMQHTRDRLRRLGWHWRELRTLWDVDRPADLRRLVESGLLRRRA